MENDPLFIGFFPGGILYADRRQEANGDHKHIASMDYESLTLQYRTDPGDLKVKIERHVADLHARRGESLRISASGQTVEIGVLTTAEMCKEKYSSPMGFGTGPRSIATTEISGMGYSISLFRDRSILGRAHDGSATYIDKATRERDAESILAEMSKKFRTKQSRGGVCVSSL